MPLYEYQCEKCHHRFEKIQKFSDPAPEHCPSCGAGPVVKLPSSPAIQFKGTGWYITDYAKKSGTDAGKTSAGEKSDKAGAASESASKDGKESGSKETKSDSAATATPTAATPAPAKKAE